MTEPFIGQIEYYGFTFAPNGWATASGQLIPLQQNPALFSLIGVAYGGNGTSNFALPNLASRQACGSGRGPGLTPRSAGDTFGEFNVTLTTQEMPGHNHQLPTYVPPDPATQIVTPTQTSALAYSAQGTSSSFAAPGTGTIMNPLMVSPSGGNLPHSNTQPYIGLNVCIALGGAFPSFG